MVTRVTETQKFRITVNDSAYRRIVLTLMLLLFIGSIWLWKVNVLQYQVLIQILLLLVLVAYFVPKIISRHPTQILLLEESGRVFWLYPEDELTWEISNNSRSTSWWHWLVLDNSLLKQQRQIIIFRDSVCEKDWRHLCRVVKARIAAM